MKLELVQIAAGYDGVKILENVNISVETGEILCLLGPNGVGKTTLFRVMLGLMKPMDGEVRIDGQSIARWGARRISKHMAYVSQYHVPPFPYIVKDVVLLGRMSSIGYFGQPGVHDYEVAERSMEDMGITHLRDRVYTDLSGGERQLVMIARALTQEPKTLVLDEPTASLDYGNMVRVMKKVTDLKNKGYGVVMTTHDPDQAFMCDSKVALLMKDAPLVFGDASHTITQKNLKAAYGIDVSVVEFVNESGRLVRVCSPDM